jgi:hypothetical protein
MSLLFHVTNMEAFTITIFLTAPTATADTTGLHPATTRWRTTPLQGVTATTTTPMFDRRRRGTSPPPDGQSGGGTVQIGLVSCPLTAGGPGVGADQALTGP